jgi:hypothetical protein
MLKEHNAVLGADLNFMIGEILSVGNFENGNPSPKYTKFFHGLFLYWFRLFQIP